MLNEVGHSGKGPEVSGQFVDDFYVWPQKELHENGFRDKSTHSSVFRVRSLGIPTPTPRCFLDSFFDIMKSSS